MVFDNTNITNKVLKNSIVFSKHWKKMSGLIEKCSVYYKNFRFVLIDKINDAII